MTWFSKYIGLVNLSLANITTASTMRQRRSVQQTIWPDVGRELGSLDQNSHLVDDSKFDM